MKILLQQTLAGPAASLALALTLLTPLQSTQAEAFGIYKCTETHRINTFRTADNGSSLWGRHSDQSKSRVYKYVIRSIEQPTLPLITIRYNLSWILSGRYYQVEESSARFTFNFQPSTTRFFQGLHLSDTYTWVSISGRTLLFHKYDCWGSPSTDSTTTPQRREANQLYPLSRFS